MGEKPKGLDLNKMIEDVTVELIKNREILMNRQKEDWKGLESTLAALVWLRGHYHESYRDIKNSYTGTDLLKSEFDHAVEYIFHLKNFLKNYQAYVSKIRIIVNDTGLKPSDHLWAFSEILNDLEKAIRKSEQ